MMNDGINFDQSDVDNDEEFEKIHKNIKKARHDFFVKGIHNHRKYGE